MNNSTNCVFLAALFNESCPNDIVCIVEVTVIIAVTFSILVGNVANLLILLSTPSLRNSHGYILLSLSVADMMIGLVASLAIYPSADRHASQESWPYGDTLCVTTAYLTQVGITISSFTLTLLSLERFIAVVYPLRYSSLATKKNTLLAIAFTWLVPASMFATIFAGFPGHVYFPTLFVCLPIFCDNPVLAVMLVVAFLPGLLFVLATSCVVSKRLATGFQCTETRSNVRHTQSKIKMKTFRMVQLMTLTFVLCYIPCLALILSSVLLNIFPPQVFVFVVYWLLLANSFFNGLVYFAMNKTYRNRLDEIFKQVGAVLSCISANNAEKSVTVLRSSQSRNMVYSNKTFDGGDDMQISNVTT